MEEGTQMSRYSDDPIDLEDLLRHTSVNRRQALKLGAVASAAGLLAACEGQQSAGGGGQASGSRGPVTMSVANTPRHETVVIEQNTTFTVFDSFNMFVPNGSNYQSGFEEICQEYLWYLNFATGKLVSWLATGYHYNGDYTQFTMTLDPKVHWSDGRPFTSKDVKFSIELLQKHPVLLNSTSVDQQAKSIATPDDHTVVIDLTTRNTRYHYDFICAVVSGLYVVPEHIWGSQDPTSFKFNPPVLTGPYKLDKVYQNQLMFVWKRHPNYWNRDRIRFAPTYVAYRNAPSADSDLQQFQAADVDESNVKWPLVASLVAQRTPNIIATTTWDPCPRGFAVNCHPSKGLLADSRMRQALSYLVDREKVASTTAQPVTIPAVYPWAPYEQNKKWENDKIVSRWAHSYNPSKAEQILDQLGARKGSDGKRSYQGQPLRYTIVSNQAPPAGTFLTCQLFQSALQSVGIDANIDVDATNYTSRQAQGNFDILYFTVCAESNDPYQLYQKYFNGENGIAPLGQNALPGQTFMRFQDDQFNRLLGQLRSADPNEPGTKNLYDQILNEFFKQQPLIMVNQVLGGTPNNTTWWTGWPTSKNLYDTPNNWWGQFLFVVSHLQPTGKR
jgi:peptide/nickel transport system substrate-binding protein